MLYERAYNSKRIFLKLQVWQLITRIYMKKLGQKIHRELQSTSVIIREKNLKNNIYVYFYIFMNLIKHTNTYIYIFGEGNGSALWYFCLGNPIDRGHWWARVCEATESWKQLSN